MGFRAGKSGPNSLVPSVGRLAVLRQTACALAGDDTELMLNHAIDLGLVEVHPPRLNPIKRVLPLQLRD